MVDQFKVNTVPISEEYTRGKLFVEDDMRGSRGKTILIPLSRKGVLFNYAFTILVISVILVPLVLLRDKGFKLQATVFFAAIFLVISPLVIFVDTRLVLKPRKLYFKKLKRLGEDQVVDHFIRLNKEEDSLQKVKQDSNGRTISYWMGKVEALEKHKQQSK